MAGAPSPKRQHRMLELMRSSGLVIAGPDHPVLRHLEIRRQARALPLYDPRSGKPTMARAWQITDAGVAAALKLAKPVGRRRRAPAEVEQIDIEDAIASASSGGAPDAAPLPVPDAPAVSAAGVSASSAAHRDMPFTGRGARGSTPETLHV